MQSMQPMNFVYPERALLDQRLIVHVTFNDPMARDGKHYLILNEDQHFIFVTAYQHSNPIINHKGERWSGGTQIEIPKPALIWLVDSLEMHNQLVERSEGKSNPRIEKSKKFLKPIARISMRGEKLSLARIQGEPFFVLTNHSRPVVLPWCTAVWTQELQLSDHVLFDQGLWGILKKLATSPKASKFI